MLGFFLIFRRNQGLECMVRCWGLGLRVLGFFLSSGETRVWSGFCLCAWVCRGAFVGTSKEMSWRIDFCPSQASRVPLDLNPREVGRATDAEFLMIGFWSLSFAFVWTGGPAHNLLTAESKDPVL